MLAIVKGYVPCPEDGRKNVEPLGAAKTLVIIGCLVAGSFWAASVIDVPPVMDVPPKDATFADFVGGDSRPGSSPT